MISLTTTSSRFLPVLMSAGFMAGACTVGTLDETGDAQQAPLSYVDEEGATITEFPATEFAELMTARAFEGISQLYDADGSLAGSFDVDAQRLEIIGFSPEDVRPEDVALDTAAAEELNHFLYASYFRRTFNPTIEESSASSESGVGSRVEAIRSGGRLQAGERLKVQIAGVLTRRVVDGVVKFSTPRNRQPQVATRVCRAAYRARNRQPRETRRHLDRIERNGQPLVAAVFRRWRFRGKPLTGVLSMAVRPIVLGVPPQDALRAGARMLATRLALSRCVTS